MAKYIVSFFILISALVVGGLVFLKDQLPPTERHMYALTAKRDMNSLYNIYADESILPDIRKFAIGQYLFLIEEDDKARVKIELEFVENRDSARTADKKQIYQFALSRLNQTLIEEQEKILLERAIDIVGQKDMQGNVYLNPAKTLSSSPSPSIGVDLVMVAEKKPHKDLSASTLAPLKFQPGFSGLSAAEIIQLASTIDKVGLIISSAYPLDTKLDGCADYIYASQASLYAVALKTSDLLTSHSLINDEPTENTTIIDPSHVDCKSSAKIPDFKNYFKISVR